MAWVTDFYRSSVGKKAVMAISGIVLFGFVVLHLLGNLKLYAGREGYNAYAEWLREMGAPALPHASLLWLVRVVLLVALALHVIAAYQLTVMNLKARPVGYYRRDAVQASYAARTMRWSGVIVLLFVIYHLGHFTLGWRWTHPQPITEDVFDNVVVGFQVWWVSAIYIAGQVALGLHLYHGLWSMFQSLGWNHPRISHWRRAFAKTTAVAITLGNISFPVAVLAGAVVREAA